MRRTITLTLDHEFIGWLDGQREGMSRGRWLEGALAPLGARVSREAPTPEADWSPEPEPESKPPREAKAERLEKTRAVLGKPALQRPLVQKRKA